MKALVLVGVLLFASTPSVAGQRAVREAASAGSTTACSDAPAHASSDGLYVITLPAGPLAVVGSQADASGAAIRWARTAPPGAVLFTGTGSSNDALGDVGIPVLRPQPVALPASALVSRRDLAFSVARMELGTTSLALLTYRSAGGQPAALALLSDVRVDGSTSVSIHLLPQPAPLSTALRVALVEHLYSLALRYPAEAVFCLAIDGAECGERESAASLLNRLATLRACLASTHAADGGLALVPWRMVSLMLAPGVGTDADLPAVRVSTAGVPIANATVIFSRAPHAGCAARSGGDGIAACRLVDPDDEPEPEVPVVATFPGEVRADLVFPPITAVLR